MPLAHLQVLISYNYWNQKNNISTIPLTNPQTLLKFTILLHTVFELHVTLSNFPAPDCLSLLLWYYFFYFISVLNLLHFFCLFVLLFVLNSSLKFQSSYTVEAKLCPWEKIWHCHIYLTIISYPVFRLLKSYLDYKASFF